MNKEESINKLLEFHTLIDNYFEGKYNNKKDIKSKINKLLPIVQDLVKKSNSLKRMTISPPPAIGGMVIKNFNPFDMIFTDLWGTSVIPEIINMIEQSISKYENDLVTFEKIENVKNLKKCNIEYTEKITFNWLYEKVPFKIWLSFFSLLIASFALGYNSYKFFNNTTNNLMVDETKIVTTKK